MKKIKLGGLVENKIGFARWILSYKEYSKELIEFREDYERINLEFQNRKEELEKELETLKNISQNETSKLNGIIAEKTNVIIRNTDSLNARNNEIQELHKELSDSIIKIDELKERIQKLQGQKGGLTKEINKLKKTNEFLKSNRRAPSREEILAYEKNVKGLLKKNKAKL